ncbi:ATP-binding protein [Formicincola oecophyllae]|uniref:ATP-binding protein n=1 Tax=Formicincola oecophyllae TaxID=2558361 RepID=A0A4Y6UDG0_9PROT|nr:ATP-binding protein [Formicincola oecophyllae]QDH14065.1 ATP-binding protein [Formicincola oecophyllae]
MVLRRFSVSNFMSFPGKAELTLGLTKREASQGWSVSAPLKSDKKEYSTATGIFGANASGKTNILKALRFMTWFAEAPLESISPKDPIMSFGWFRNDQPSEYELEYYSEDNSIMRYYLKANKKVILEESLTRLDLKGKVRSKGTLFKRSWNPKTEKYVFGERNMGFEDVPAHLARPNASFLSLAQHLGVGTKKFMLPSIYSNVEPYGRVPTVNDFPVAQGFFLEPKNVQFWNQALEFLTEVDLGLSNVTLKKMNLNLPKGNMDASKSTQEFVNMIAYHKLKDGSEKALNFLQESNGTRAVFVHLALLLPVLAEGGIAIIDEIESELHPDLVEKILGLFNDPLTNPGKGQLIFTSHTPSLMNELGKAHIYLTEKIDNESDLWSLNDMNGVRVADNFAAKYRAGAYGGVPQL